MTKIKLEQGEFYRITGLDSRSREKLNAQAMYVRQESLGSNKRSWNVFAYLEKGIMKRIRISESATQIDREYPKHVYSSNGRLVVREILPGREHSPIIKSFLEEARELSFKGGGPPTFLEGVLDMVSIVHDL